MSFANDSQAGIFVASFELSEEKMAVTDTALKTQVGRRS